MMEAETTPEKDPLALDDDPAPVKDAQKEIALTDILVCGGCRAVFYFTQEFTEHKTKCDKDATKFIKLNRDERPIIWAFHLWRSKQLQEIKEKKDDKVVPSLQDSYEKWTKLSEDEQEIWVAAGKSLQCFNWIATSKDSKDDKEKISLEDVADSEKNGNMAPPKNSKGTKRGYKSQSSDKVEYNVEKITSKRYSHKTKSWEYQVKWENYKEETWEPASNLENCKALIEEFEQRHKAEQKTPTPGTPRGRGRPRVNPGSSPVRILQKKPQTTPELVPSEGRPQRSSKQRALNQVKQWCGNISDTDEPPLKRPLEDDDSDDSLEKRLKLGGTESEDTEEDNLPKKSTTNTSTTAGTTPVTTTTTRTGSSVTPYPPAKKQATARIVQFNNGLGKKIPDNVLIPDARGVVRISQKQLPSLSSGVYIMSKSSGIIKLDPAASKIATSGGQAIVKVGPRIGQTQIRIIKKDDGGKTRVLQMKPEQPVAPKPTRFISPEPTKAPPVIKKDQFRKIEPKIVVKESPNVPKEDGDKTKDEESDDGIEELEFPTDIPIPGPDSPPGDFTLDPITGKIAGRDYPDPEPEPVVNIKMENSSETIDNIVKLAAADITEDDLKPDEPVSEVATVTASSTASTGTTTASVSTATTTVKTTVVGHAPTLLATITPVTTAVTPSIKQQQHRQQQQQQQPLTVVTVVSEPKSAHTIINTAMANSNILQKTLMTPSKPRQKIQPRILNQVVSNRSRGTPLATQQQPKTTTTTVTGSGGAVIRQKTEPTIIKPKFNISPATPASRNVFTKTHSTSPATSTQKRVSNTGVYRTKTYPGNTPRTVASKPTAAILVKESPKAVINMPSLEEDTTGTEQIAVATVAATAPVASTATTVVTGGGLSTFAITEDDKPVFITADDGTVYQVAGHNEEGQTILLTQDSDGQQQCLLVTNEPVKEMAQVSAVAGVASGLGEVMMETEQETEVVAEEQPVVAQLIRTEPPSPGGTHKVVVMLPSGEMMVTHMSPEEYANLELDK